MNYKEIDDLIVELIRGNDNFQRYLLNSPTVMHIPFMGSREVFFISISLFFRPELVDRSTLPAMCMSIIHAIIESGFLTEEKGIEIAVYLPHQSELPQPQSQRQRLMRLSVKDSAFSKVLEISSNQSLTSSHEGIALHWRKE